MGKNPDDNFDMSDFNMGDDSYGNEGDMYGDEDKSVVARPGQNFDAPQQQPSPSSYSNPEKKIVNLTSDIPVQIVAVLGKKTVAVKDIVAMKMGQVLELGKLPNEAIDLVANGKLIAKGELVEIDGRLGVRILKMFE